MNDVTLTPEQYRKLVNGQFSVRRCTTCFGKGWYWVHDDGTRRDPTGSEPVEEFYKHPCNFDDTECGGHGFFVVYAK